LDGEWLAKHIPGAEARLLDDDGQATLVNHVPEVHAWLSEHLQRAIEPCLPCRDQRRGGHSRRAVSSRQTCLAAKVNIYSDRSVQVNAGSSGANLPLPIRPQSRACSWFPDSVGLEQHVIDYTVCRALPQRAVSR
jgi:hypothetical protein